MQRDIIAKLNAWKASEYRKPLILKGARQVGKTWALKEFGRTSYRNFVYLTLEEPSPGYRASTLSFSKVRAILDGSSQIFPGTWTAYRARRNAAYY
ncbi:MAG: AAA family ATPase [Collinsella sp.]